MADRIGIVGAGVMGGGIAQVAAQNGYEVCIIDLGQKQLDDAMRRITTGLNRGVERGVFDASVRDRAIESVKTTLNLEEVARSPLLIEAIWEEQPEKEALLASGANPCPR